MKLSRKFAVIIGSFYIVAAVLAVLLVNSAMRREALREAEAKALIILNRNLATHRYFSEQLKPKVFELSDPFRPKGYFEPAWMSSTYAVREIDKNFKSLTDAAYYYKECAINARFPENEADAYEREFIRQLNTDPSQTKRSGVRLIDGSPFYSVLIKGETMDDSCLRCHSTPAQAPGGLVERYGPDRSFGRHSAEVVSAVSIRIPLAKAYTQANIVSATLSGLFLSILVSLFLVQVYFNRRLFLDPVNAIKEKAIKISTGEDHLGESIPEPDGMELRELTVAFNGMSRSLRFHIDNLDSLVSQRTEALRALNEQLSDDIEQRKAVEEERERLIRELTEALGKIKKLSGLLPICSSCKRIRDDKGYWSLIESYISEHSEAEFTHSLCPDCIIRLYPDYFGRKGEERPPENELPDPQGPQ